MSRKSGFEPGPRGSGAGPLNGWTGPLGAGSGPVENARTRTELDRGQCSTVNRLVNRTSLLTSLTIAICPGHLCEADSFKFGVGVLGVIINAFCALCKPTLIYLHPILWTTPNSSGNVGVLGVNIDAFRVHFASHH